MHKRKVTVQFDRSYLQCSPNTMAYLYASIQEQETPITIHLGPADTRMIFEWFMLGQIDELKLEKWPGPQ